jgi:hypothetical protein
VTGTRPSSSTLIELQIVLLGKYPLCRHEVLIEMPRDRNFRLA